MKGILLKDCYEMIYACRILIILMLIVSALGIFSDNSFLIIYPCAVASMSSITLLMNDEREKWERYAQVLPYTRAQLVSSKYILSLGLGLLALIINLVCQSIRMLIFNNFDGEILILILWEIAVIITLPNAAMLPFLYRFGTSKGRILFFVAVIAICAASMAVDKITVGLRGLIDNKTASLTIFLLLALIYALSWRLSIRFYEKREL